jgi:hypothetical protein
MPFSKALRSFSPRQDYGMPQNRYLSSQVIRCECDNNIARTPRRPNTTQASLRSYKGSLTHDAWCGARPRRMPMTTRSTAAQIRAPLKTYGPMIDGTHQIARSVFQRTVCRNMSDSSRNLRIYLRTTVNHRRSIHGSTAVHSFIQSKQSCSQ